MKAYKVTTEGSDIDIIEVDYLFPDDLYEEGVFVTYDDAFRAAKEYGEDLICKIEEEIAKITKRLQELGNRMDGSNIDKE